MACPAKTELSAYADGERTAATKADIAAHLASCPGCRGALEALRAVGTRLKSLPERPLPAGFMARLNARRTAPPPALHAPYFAAAAGALAAVLIAYRAWPPTPPAPELLEPLAPAPATAAPELPENQPPEIGNRGGVFGAKAPSQKKLTNEALHARLQDEAQEMGITGIQAPGEDDFQDSRDEAPPPMSEAGRLAATRAYARQIEAMRRAMTAGEIESIPVAGRTSILLGETQARAGGKPVGEPVWSGEFGGAEQPGTRTITDKDDWLATWKSVSKEPPPEIDFSRYEIVAVFLGPRDTGGYLPEIVEILQGESEITVRYREKAPAPGRTPPQGETSPYTLRAIPRSALPVRFERAN